MKTVTTRRTKTCASTARKDRSACHATAAWLHDLGYVVLPRFRPARAEASDAAQSPAMPWRSFHTRQMPWNRLHDYLTNDRCCGIGVVAGQTSNLIVLNIDDTQMTQVLRPLISPRVMRQVSWYKSPRGLHLWFRFEGTIRINQSMLNKDGVDLLVNKRFAVCPPHPESRTFSGPIVAPVNLPPVPEALIDWFLSPRGMDFPTGSLRELAHWFWRDNRTSVPKGSRTGTLFKAARYLLARTSDPLRVQMHLVKCAHEIDGLPAAQAINCCENAHALVRRKVMAGHKSYAFDDELFGVTEAKRSDKRPPSQPGITDSRPCLRFAPSLKGARAQP